jgi:hypothetical protein
MAPWPFIWISSTCSLACYALWAVAVKSLSKALWIVVYFLIALRFRRIQSIERVFQKTFELSFSSANLQSGLVSALIVQYECKPPYS